MSTTSYTRAAIDGEAANVALAKTTSRNTILNQAAFRLGTIPGMPTETAVSALMLAAGANGYLAEHGERATRRTIEGGLRAGAKNMRAAPEERRDQHRPTIPLPASGETKLAASGGFPKRTPPDAGGKPAFHTWDAGGPPVRPDEKRRHVYAASGVTVRIKVMRKDGGAINWYRVQKESGVTGWQARKPDGYVEVPYTAGTDPFDAEVSQNEIFCPEGEKDVDTLVRLGLLAMTFGGTGDGAPAGMENNFAGRDVVVLADNDEGGRQHAERKASLIARIAQSVRVVHFSELPEKGDVSDWIASGQGVEDLRARVASAPLWQAPVNAPSIPLDQSPQWNEPIPLPDGLKPVHAFDFEFLPASIRPWVQDISDRMQCPPDFVGVSAMVALGATIGRKVGIRPQTRTDWIEVPNLWGCIVGRPGAMKSPAIAEALKPLHRLEKQARVNNEAALRDFAHAREVHELKKQAAQAKVKAAVKKGLEIELPHIDEPEAPALQRFVVNDTTYEKLGEILAHNPSGVLAHRDELVSLLKSLDREEAAPARGFYLTAWNGTGGYTFDRIIRGQTHIDAACLSMLGSTQPGKIAEYMRRAITGGAGDDGLIQRFGLLVWPDQSPEWIEADRYPDSEARNEAWGTFTRLAEVTSVTLKAEMDRFETIPFLRFDTAARGIFADWHADLERRLRSGQMHSALESHLSKYRKLVPSLALINHLSEGNVGPVDEPSTSRAISMSRYLESHARRLYGAGTEAETSAAKAILEHIRRGALVDGFTARDIHQRDWSRLTDKEQVRAGLALLEEFDWITADPIKTGGRSKTAYRINPMAIQ
jgi:Protein of unknown function (DUF3987)